MILKIIGAKVYNILMQRFLTSKVSYVLQQLTYQAYGQLFRVLKFNDLTIWKFEDLKSYDDDFQIVKLEIFKSSLNSKSTQGFGNSKVFLV